MIARVWAAGAILLPCLFIACSAEDSSSGGGDSGTGNGGRNGSGGVSGSKGGGAKGGPYKVNPRPYTNGLPTNFPSYCQIIR